MVIEVPPRAPHSLSRRETRGPFVTRARARSSPPRARTRSLATYLSSGKDVLIKKKRRFVAGGNAQHIFRAFDRNPLPLVETGALPSLLWYQCVSDGGVDAPLGCGAAGWSVVGAAGLDAHRQSSGGHLPGD